MLRQIATLERKNLNENGRKVKVKARVTEQRLNLKRKGFSIGNSLTNLVSIIFSKGCHGEKFSWIFKQRK